MSPSCKTNVRVFESQDGHFFSIAKINEIKGSQFVFFSALCDFEKENIKNLGLLIFPVQKKAVFESQEYPFGYFLALHNN